MGLGRETQSAGHRETHPTCCQSNAPLHHKTARLNCLLCCEELGWAEIVFFPPRIKGSKERIDLQWNNLGCERWNCRKPDFYEKCLPHSWVSTDISYNAGEYGALLTRTFKRSGHKRKHFVFLYASEVQSKHIYMKKTIWFLRKQHQSVPYKFCK